MNAANTTVAPDEPGNPVVTRLQERLAERDEIIVSLQHIIRDLCHEIDNLRAESAYAALARSGRDRGHADHARGSLDSFRSAHRFTGNARWASAPE